MPTEQGIEKENQPAQPSTENSSTSGAIWGTGVVRDQTRRHLKSRHVQLIGIGGSIGTVLFVQMGFVLPNGGPGSLFVAFLFWSTVVLAVNNCLAEMTSWMPITSPFIRYADHFVDPALGITSAFNYFALTATSIPFEIIAVNLLLQFWTDKIPVVVEIFVVLGIYLALNVFAVKYFGESEFWLALGKVLLACGLVVFTFVTMVGGNPKHDAFGFRNWNPARVPGAPFASYEKTGNLGQFIGFLSCLIQASATIIGPEYISVTAGEVYNPRRTLPRAFRSTFARLLVFYVLVALSVGVLIPYSSPELAKIIADPGPGASASPFVLAMQQLGVNGSLMHVVNALIMLSAFSAGNGFVYSAARCLYGISLEGALVSRKRGPVMTRLGWCTQKGVPVWCVGIACLFGFLAFLQLNDSAGKILQWILKLTVVSTAFNYSCISLSYIRFHKALKIHHISRDTLPYKGKWQPFCAYYAFIFNSLMIGLEIYSLFMTGSFDIPSIAFAFAMVVLLPLVYITTKISCGTKIRDLEAVDFFKEERRLVDEHEKNLRKGDVKNESVT